MSAERIDTATMIDRAAKRADWAARALAAAAREMEQVAAEGVAINSTADLARSEADCASELARRIAAVGTVAGRDHRVRDRL